MFLLMNHQFYREILTGMQKMRKEEIKQATRQKKASQNKSQGSLSET